MRKILILLLFIHSLAFGQDTLYDKSGKPKYIEIVEEPPIPPVVYTSIDNVDTKIVYTGTWISGSTNAPGFYPTDKPTLAYSNLAGNTSLTNFTGSYLEAYLEHKTGHGSARLQIDNLPDTLINFGLSGTGGSSLVLKKKLTPGQHTFKITVVGTGNIVFDYLRTDGAAVEPPVPPIPPVTGDIIVSAGQSIKTAVETATSGKIVFIKNGGYYENVVNVPVGVTIKGESRNGVIINLTGTHPAQSETAIFQLKSGSRTNGNQTISGLTIVGTSSGSGGIMVDNRDNVTITDVRIQDMNFSGVWLKNTTGSKLTYSELTNNSWASSGWVSGEVNLFNADVDVSYNTITNNKVGANGWSSKGYGVKCLWQNGTVKGKINHNTIDLPPQSLWNNGQSPNISIEFNDAYPKGVEIAWNKVKNGISMACHKHSTAADEIWVHDNDMSELTTNSTFAVEITCDYIKIERNKIRNAMMLTANYNPNGTNNGHWTGVKVINNDFIANGVNASWGGVFLIGLGGMDIYYQDNKLTTKGYTLFKHTGPTSASAIINGGGNVMN